MGKRHDVEETGTPLECGIAGVLSTYPPFTAQHPMTLLPIAKAIVAALPEWSDDLLAVLVEEGVMEQVGWQDEAGYLHYDRRSMVGAVVPVYIRTEGNTR